MMSITFELNEIEKTAKKFLEIAGTHKVLAFSGDLGAGKTTFINSVCKELGVKETVTSPTYSIIQEYSAAGNKVIYHIDLYRINNREEAIEAGIEDCIYSDEICMIEWPERAPAIFPDDTLYVTFKILSPISRKLLIELPQ